MGKNLFQNNEQRRFDRKQLFYYLKVFHQETNELAGYLGDISTEGIMIFTKQAISLDADFKFTINLDEELEMDGKLTVEATSVWQEKDANPDYFIIGFKYIDMDQENLDLVKYLIKKYGFDK